MTSVPLIKNSQGLGLSLDMCLCLINPCRYKTLESENSLGRVTTGPGNPGAEKWRETAARLARYAQWSLAKQVLLYFFGCLY